MGFCFPAGSWLIQLLNHVLETLPCLTRFERVSRAFCSLPLALVLGHSAVQEVLHWVPIIPTHPYFLWSWLSEWMVPLLTQCSNPKEPFLVILFLSTSTCHPIYHKVLSPFLQSISSICPFLLLYTVNNLTQASIISNFDHFNGLLTVLPTSSFQFIFQPADRVTYLTSKSDYITPLHPLKPHVVALRLTSKSQHDLKLPASSGLSDNISYFLALFFLKEFGTYLYKD